MPTTGHHTQMTKNKKVEIENGGYDEYDESSEDYGRDGERKDAVKGTGLRAQR